MPRYKVELISIDEADVEKDNFFKTVVEASNKDDAISMAKVKQKDMHFDLNPGANWAWYAYETAEKGEQED